MTDRRRRSRHRRSAPARFVAGRFVASLFVTGVTVAGVTVACGADTARTTSWPDVEIERLDDASPVSSGRIADGPTVVTVWAVWCVPCRKELPELETLAGDYDDRFAVVGVNNGDDPVAARAFLDEIGVTFPQYRDPLARLTSALDIVSVPATLVVDAAGNVTWRHLGAVDIADVRAEVDRVLNAAN
jgi:thiol-disulfide isomerase/thioredoxin